MNIHTLSINTLRAIVNAVGQRGLYQQSGIDKMGASLPDPLSVEPKLAFGFLQDLEMK